MSSGGVSDGEKRQCVNCGASLTRYSKFCSECGTEQDLDDDSGARGQTDPTETDEQDVKTHNEEARKRDQMRTFVMWNLIILVLGYSVIVVQQALFGALAAGGIYLVFWYVSRHNDGQSGGPGGEPGDRG